MPRVKIISLTNPHVKDLVRLRTAPHRKDSGLTIVEGTREILRALEGGIKFQEFYLCPEVFNGTAEGKKLQARMSSSGVPVREVTRPVFAKTAYGEREEGVIGVCAIPRRSLADFRLPPNPLVVVMEHVEKPGNLGAILRTCDAAGVDGVMVCDAKTDLYNPNVIRASVGTVFTVKTVVCSNEEAFRFLKEKGMRVCAASPEAQTFYTQVAWTGPAAIVLGSEEEGLSDFWDRNAHTQVRIPMRGRADSLNVSTSAAILIYEALRQREIKN